MPKRMIRDEIIHTEGYWSVCDEAKVLFYHLWLSADDTGRYSGNNFTIRSRCFPSRGIEPQRLETLLDELTANDLIRMYQADGERYIFIPKFKQTCRYINSKYPEPPEQISDIIISIDEKGKATVTPKTCLSNAQVSRREVKRREEKKNISTKNLSLGKPIPDDFTISDEIKQWFGEQKNVYNLEAHFKYFVSQAKAKGYKSADWDEYLKNAILQNWARVEPPAGMALMRGVTYAK
jgi:hypothetical protein